MNNRYLYRAKRVDNGEFVIGNYQRRFDLLGNEEHYIFCSKSHNAWEYAEVDPSTIRQCTGLKDKNGKLIWEGDIIRYEDIIIGKQKSDRIVWNKYHAGFCIEHESKMGLQLLYMNGCLGRDSEVIGNIFDNKELLEVEE